MAQYKAKMEEKLKEGADLKLQVTQLQEHATQLQANFKQKELQLKQKYDSQLQLEKVSRFSDIVCDLSLWPSHFAGDTSKSGD